MSATDPIEAGDPLPRIHAVRASAKSPFSIEVEWAEGARARRRDVVDLAPVVLAYKVYRPLRGDAELFRAVDVVHWGTALRWGGDEALEMAASTVERLAEQTMTNADFAAFLKRRRLTLDAAAAQLGISRRLVAYYARERTVPRVVALACAHLDATLGRQ